MFWIQRTAAAWTAFVGAGLLSTFAATPAQAVTVAPGLSVSEYAQVGDPVTMSFDSAGNLFVGTSPEDAPGGVVAISRVENGTRGVVTFGPSVPDPDAVLVDTNGQIATIADSVIVGGIHSPGQAGLVIIHPDRSSSVLLEPTSEAQNPTDLILDSRGRLLFADYNRQDVKVLDQGVLSSLFSIGSEAFSLTYDAATDQIYTAGIDGIVRVHDGDGQLINSNFSQHEAGLATITFGPGLNGLGLGLYGIDFNGALLGFDSAGQATSLGSGFDAVDLAFGPDGALYVSENSQDRILRIETNDAPITPGLETAMPEPATLSLLALAGGTLLTRRRRVR